MSHKQHYWRVVGQQIWRFLALGFYSKKTRTSPRPRGPLGALCMLLIELEIIVLFVFAEWAQKDSGMLSGTCEEYMEGRDQFNEFVLTMAVFRYALVSKTTYQRIGFTLVNKSIKKIMSVNNWNKTKRSFVSKLKNKIGLSYKSPQTFSFHLKKCDLHNQLLVGHKKHFVKHDDVIKWKHFLRYRSPVNSTHKDQRRGAWMFPSICAWINGWAKNQEADDLRRHRAHYDVSVMVR